ncbi:uncharacterized protein YgbK (DUF1537 family) [Geomicrobium halophilum]|uniref:Uncharacterized protein YgbK (DUF1537 family) n=1 Tax=Geomicrobium halophilum TaxID=549000 RepID=A0A841PLX9_9BACL|nr:four-carbon acid sugar kinase family protein [Geomicrobium halophilum]MBB6448714.1 uncharacterized protein YgbK (DUF1537 family) [Geomicrobium halophilum]
MRISILADDLTGANDSGVQLARHGLKTSVLLAPVTDSLAEVEAAVFDTDSRSISAKDAYQKVKQTAENIRSEGFDLVYKKIDSTLRGNIGKEIDAMYDVFAPDFVIISPSYPKNKRQVIDGVHYLNGVRLDETEFAQNPKDPITEAYLPSLIQQQTERAVGFVGREDLKMGSDHVQHKLGVYHNDGIPYLVFDAEAEEHLRQTAAYIFESNYRVLWVGSAGLAHHLPAVCGFGKQTASFSVAKNNQSVLFVIGSVSAVSRKQLERLLQEPKVEGVRMQPDRVINSSVEKNEEVQRMIDAGKRALDNGRHVALYSSASKSDIEQVQKITANVGITPHEASIDIVSALGEAAVPLMDEEKVSGVVMTGGDTAKQVCTHVQAEGFELLDEMETGIPLGRFLSGKSMYAVTKAGAFGSDETFVKAIHKLQGADRL